MKPYHFNTRVLDHGIELSLEKAQRNWLGRECREALARNSWPSSDELHAVSAFARLEACIEEERGVELLADGEGYLLSHSTVAELTESQSQALGLPRNIPYELRLAITGPMVEPRTKINLGWYATAGRRVAGQEKGAIFVDGRESYRIPEPLFGLIQAVDNYNDWDGQDLDERLGYLSTVKLLVERCTSDSLNLDRQLTDLRLRHASSVSLDISVHDQAIDFDPVLFNKEAVTEAIEQGALVEESRQLLPPALQPQFAEQFRRRPEARRTYALGKNQFVFIDPSLRDALTCIKTAQTASPEERARFAKSPQSYIKQKLIEQGVDDEVADQRVLSAFVETDRFSERVLEVGLWQPPVLPFVTREPNTWLPEGFGVKVGSKSYVIPEQSIEKVANELATAIKEGTASVAIDDSSERLPARAETLTAVNQLLVEVMKLPAIETQVIDDLEAELGPEELPPPSDNKPSRSVLLVQNNFETETFVAQFEARSEFSGYQTPNGLLNEPKAHQVEGMEWLQQCWALGYPGVLLADDMGLGKTFQTLGFLSWLFETRAKNGLTNRPALILAPTSLLGNWENEARQHLSAQQIGQVELLYGPYVKKLKVNGVSGNDVTNGSKTLDVERLKSAQWVLTTYETMRDYHISLAGISFSCLIFDEMQKIKTPTSMMTNAAQALNAEFKIGLTGTPIENSLADLWTLFDTLMPGALGLGDLKHFLASYNLEQPEALKELKQRLTVSQAGRPAPMLRRMKSEVAKDLPKKSEYLIDVVMPQEQATRYSEAVALGRDGGTRQQKLEAFQSLRNVSLHPYFPDGEEAEDADAYVRMSSRLNATIDKLDEIHRNGEKALVFIESRAMHEWLAFYLKERYSMSNRPARIYGATSSQERSKIVEHFQNQRNKGFDVLLLSPKAAGVGLTLTAATHVIHLSRWWNPAVEDQCTDRAYRIGQDQDVSVYIPRAVHPLYGDASFDRVLHDLLESKRQLSRDMLIPMETKADFDDAFRRTMEVE